MPASDILLGAFVAEHSGTCTGKAIRNWLNGLRLWHIYNDAAWHGREGWLPNLLRSADKKGEQFRRLPRGPITVEHLRALRAYLDFENPRDAAIWAAALAAFWGCRRLGELLISSANKFDLTHDVIRSTRMSRLTVGNRVVLSFHLPWTKTTRVAGGECILTQTGDDLCPVWAMDNHMRLNHTPNRDTPMFAFRKDSDWVSLLKQEFLDFSGAIFKSRNLENVFGHSYRIGGSLRLLLDGVPPETVMKLGGWTSLCFLIYWRRLEQVIPLAITRAWDAQIVAFAQSNGLNSDIHDIDLHFSN